MNGRAGATGTTPFPAPDVERERRLVASARAGDDRAFAELVRPVYPMAYRVCVHITRNDQEAQDATQAALTAAWRHLHAFDGRSRFSTWVHRIAANAALAVVRQRGPAAELPQEVGDPARAPGDVVPDVDAVRRALHRLAPGFRAAIVLREFAGLSYQEIADAEGIRVETVKTRIARARRTLTCLLLDDQA